MKPLLLLPVRLRGILLLVFLGPAPGLNAQSCYWQQRVRYRMNVVLNTRTNRLKGTEHLEYTNNSPDTLHQVFFHLYWNAFQPGSMMDMRSRQLGKIIYGVDPKGDTVRDWDPRIAGRIGHLRPDQIGYDSVTYLFMDGRPQHFRIEETIMQVKPDRPIPPHSRVNFDLAFKDQVSIQIRRSGRDNAEGVRYSMSQWYPKICEYDRRGWHPTPYVQREFYGVWGDYDVTISLNRHYLVGASGYLQNASRVGYGYQKPGTRVDRPPGPMLTWHFYAPEVHDFVWAADPDYIHISRTLSNAAHTTIHVIYKKNPATDAAWKELLDAATRVLPYMERHFGPYPFHQYSFIQGGDGGMEYPMATLIEGPSLGDAFHEWMHSWYQMMLGTNESLLPWMDEGFTTYAEGKISDYYDHAFSGPYFKQDTADRRRTLYRLDHDLPLGEANAYRGYYMLVRSGLAEPMTTHADHYHTNFAYEENAYSKGAVFLEQLGYIVGRKTLGRILLAYYWKWRFKHPDANDFFRVAEQVSGIKLDWYEEYWIYTTKTIDYAIDTAWACGDSTCILLRRIGAIPMPIDLSVTRKDGSRDLAYIPMDLMFGSKENDHPHSRRFVQDPWPWTNPDYTVKIPVPYDSLKELEIDPSRRMADIDRRDNTYVPADP